MLLLDNLLERQHLEYCINPYRGISKFKASIVKNKIKLYLYKICVIILI